MYLSKIEIENYRTFRHLEMTFHERVNYLVGDNNIGKSNFLDLLQTTLSGQGFRESDFLDADQPIRVIYTLSTGDTEQEETGRIKLTQYVHEAAPKLENEDTGEPLPLEYIRRMYYISQSMPEAMQRENAAAVTEEVRELFEACFLLTGEERAQLEAAFARAGITVDISGSCETAALRLMHAIFWERRRGAGRSTMQLLFAAGTYILAKLYQKKKSRAVPFEELVITDRKGKRYLPVLVSIDEPEQHLHPYMQRAVLSFLQRILNNREPFFVHLLQKVLGIDGLDGQIFVVTHSADALINDYRTIIRLYWSEAQEVRRLRRRLPFRSGDREAPDHAFPGGEGSALCAVRPAGGGGDGVRLLRALCAHPQGGLRLSRHLPHQCPGRELHRQDRPADAPVPCAGGVLL